MTKKGSEKKPLDAEFERRYKRLNTEQKQAVDTIDGPVMVIAGPGTGKTTILTLHIANILRLTDTPASGILAISFTDAGVKAMRMKLREVIGARADEVRIYTFHSFASAVIAEFPEHFVHIARAQQMTDIEAQELVRGILKDKKFKMIRPLGEPDHYVSSILKAISDAKREALTPEMVRDFARSEAERISKDPDSISTRGATKGQLKAEARKQIEKAEKTLLFADVYEAYEAKKRAGGSGAAGGVNSGAAARKIDFDDLIFELLQAIRTDELLRSLIQEKYLYLLVDEHQDTNDSQNAIIRAIADFFDSPNLFVVGDEKQAIYRFQGASVQNFLRFQNAWKNMQVISLEENYRSHQHILDAGFSLIENNYAEGEHPLLRVKLRAGKQGGGMDEEKPRPIEVVTAGNSAAADMALVERLKDFIAKNTRAFEAAGAGAVEEKTAAIIVRRNRDVERLATLCEAHGVHAVSERGINIFLHPIGALFFDLIHFLHDPSQTEALAVTLASGLWGVEFARAAELIRLVKSGKGASATLTHEGKTAEVLNALPLVATVREEMTQRGGLAFLVYAAEQSGLLLVIAKSPANTEVWRGIVALATELAGRDRAYADDPRRLIEALLSYRATAETRSVKILSGTPDAPVRIMTAHGSKGLEYDEVFLPYAVNESWLTRPRSASFLLPGQVKNEGDELRDARRLFYVALTRARRHVTIITPLEDGSGKAFTPLGFVEELGDGADAGNVSRTEIPAISDNAFVLAKTRGKVRRNEELAAYAKTILFEKGLSVTALNHFLECPQQFLYKSIIKVPEPPSAKSEGGSAMHLAMDRVWHLVRAKNREDSGEVSVKKIEAEILSATSEYLDKSLLPSFEKEAIREELKETTPEVATALAPHFAQQGEVFTETWFETQEAGIRLHGKMDAVIDTSGSTEGDIVRVFDYKTSQAKSEAAIKGETKSDSSGNYFRQLIFYYILLSAQSKYQGKRIEPALVFIKPDDKGRCQTVALPIGPTDVSRVKGEIAELVESVQSGDLVNARCENEECGWCRLARMVR